MRDFFEEYGFCLLSSIFLPILMIFSTLFLTNHVNILLNILIGVIIILIGAIIILIGPIIGIVLIRKLITHQKLKNKEKEEESIDQTIETEEPMITQHYPTITKLMDMIEEKIEKGYTFSTISLDKWQNVYRKEILSCISTSYRIPKEDQTKIETILKTLNQDLENTEEKKETLKREVTIDTIEKLLKMDGLERDF